MPENEWDKKTIALAAFILFGSGSGVVNTVVPSFRADAFTRSDFKEEKAAMTDRIYKNEADIEDLNAQMSQHRHEAPPRWVIERLNHLEQELHRLGGE